MTEVNVVAIVKIKPEHVKDAEPLIQILIQKTRAEPGNIKYEVHSVKGKEGVYLFLETFKDQDAFSTHRTAEHIAIWRQSSKDYLLQPTTVAILQKTAL